MTYSKEQMIDFLNYFTENGIVDITEADLDSINEDMKNKEYLKKHEEKYKTWLGKDGYWKSYVPDPSKPKGRRLISKKNKGDLETEIAKAMKACDAITLGDLFEEYLERKVTLGKLRPSSCDTYRQVFDRHYVKTGWNRKDIKQLDSEDFTEFLEEECARNNLTPRSFGNLKTVTKGILKRALKNHLINYSFSAVFDAIEVKPKKKTYTAEEEIFTMQELPKLISYLSDPENRDIQNLALLFMILSGVRVGEAVALTFDDFVSDTAAIVHRTESKHKVNGQYVYEVFEATKTEAGYRKVFINSDFAWIIKEMRKLRPFAKYICTNEKGKRMTTNCLRRRLNRICEKLDFKYKKSTHKLRKTFCTIIMDNGFDENLITSLMGHTDIRTSEHFYHFDCKPDDKKQQMIDNIFEFKAV